MYFTFPVFPIQKDFHQVQLCFLRYRILRGLFESILNTEQRQIGK